MKNGVPNQTFTAIDAEPRDPGRRRARARSEAERVQHPVEGRVGRVEQPPPAERRHRQRDHPRHQQQAAPEPLVARRDVVHQVREDEAEERLQDHRGDREEAALEDHQLEGVAFQQEGEVAEPDERGHPLVQHAQIDRVDRRIDHQPRDQQDQRQRQQDGRWSIVVARSAACGLARRAEARRPVMTPIGTLVPSAIGGLPIARRRSARRSPSNSSCAQAIACLIDWPLCSFANIVGMRAAVVDLHRDLRRRRRARRCCASNCAPGAIG